MYVFQVMDPRRWSNVGCVDYVRVYVSPTSPLAWVIGFGNPFLPAMLVLRSSTANEGPMRIQYKCLVPIYVFPKKKLLFPRQNYNVLSPSSYTHSYMYLWEIFYIFSESVCLFCCREVCGPILGIYINCSQTHECGNWLRSRNSQKRNI